MFTNLIKILRLFEIGIIKNEAELIIILLVYEMINDHAPIEYMLVLLQDVSLEARQYLHIMYPFL